ncbi:peroxisome assembly protein 26 [Trichomycterus rosablanca]|uniref:peroxisome assembly protein 26 n=1 Tax=Trichomycterus rosablanca TaxID=2290929 RepID=UPI002F3611D0
MQSCGLASVRLSSPAQFGSLTHGAGLLDTAIEHLIRNDFHPAFDTCEKGLELLASSDGQEDIRHGEIKASLCIVGIQALAEQNQWCDVLTWAIRHYGEIEQIPAKIMQMCIILYTKVAEQAAVQELVRTWLHCSVNANLSGYSSVAELYLLHILLPLGLNTEAKVLLENEVGQAAFNDEQRQNALALLDGYGAETESPSNPSQEPAPGKLEEVNTAQGSVIRKLRAIIKLLCRGLCSAQATVWSCFFRRTAVLLFLLYLLFIRMDSASPSAFSWILRLHGLLQQMWNALFGPYYRAFS